MLQKDAELLQNFLVTELDFDSVYLFSDESPKINNNSTHPSRSNLIAILDERFEEKFMEDGDNFWFFFSGHGYRHNDRDYLMPIDCYPKKIEQTAISINYISERLRRCGADNVVFVADACRDSGQRSGLGIGTHKGSSLKLRKGFVSFFSCSPKEYSYECTGLEQGIFTHALIEALRISGEGNCATVERLDKYLQHRVPELSRKYKKPEQSPYTIVEPAAKLHLILIPKNANVSDIDLLKADAYKYQNAGSFEDLEFSRQLWHRVLVASQGEDPDALQAISKINNLLNEISTLKNKVARLKKEAQAYEESGNFESAKQVWHSIIGISSGKDEDAEKAIRKIEQKIRLQIEEAFKEQDKVYIEQKITKLKREAEKFYSLGKLEFARENWRMIMGFSSGKDSNAETKITEINNEIKIKKDRETGKKLFLH